MYFNIKNLKYSGPDSTRPADLPHSNYDTISVILLAETAMLNSAGHFMQSFPKTINIIII